MNELLMEINGLLVFVNVVSLGEMTVSAIMWFGLFILYIFADLTLKPFNKFLKFIKDTMELYESIFGNSLALFLLTLFIILIKNSIC